MGGRPHVASKLSSVHGWGPTCRDRGFCRQTSFVKEDHEFNLDMLSLGFLQKIPVARSSRTWMVTFGTQKRNLDWRQKLSAYPQSCQPIHREKVATTGQETRESLYCL